MQPWHTLDPETVLETVGGRPEGLAAAEARRRLREVGPNSLPPPKGESLWKLVGRQVASPLVLVLLASGTLAMAMGRYTDAAVVLAVVALNALVGVLQEYKAGRAIAALGDLIPEHALVVRDGRRQNLAASDLVPGDLVEIQSGDRIPADLRLLQVRDLRVLESTLTGESLPVAKGTEPVAADAALGDRTSMAYRGTIVLSGLARGVVVATGLQTELGRISQFLQAIAPGATPLMKRLDRLGRLLTVAILGVTILVFGIGLLRGWGWMDGAMAALSLAVAAIPEGLPAIVSIALAIGVRRMARRQAIIRHLPAVETLGSTTVICTDKTGTLTRNEMVVRRIWTEAGEMHVEGHGYGPEGFLARPDGTRLAPGEIPGELLSAGVLGGDATLIQEQGQWVLHGDPTEGALVAAALRAGLDPEALRVGHPRLDVLPFESGRQFMATLHRWGTGNRLLVKGSPEAVLPRCSRGQGAAGELDRPKVAQAAAELASQGLRVLALATKPTPRDRIDSEDLEALVFLGLQGMIDPPRPESAASIAACQRAGIAVKMITGDHPQTASAIGRDLGLAGAVRTGPELARLSEEAFSRAVREGVVFARVAPEQKLRIVECLQAQGEVVAMTGDGVNDAPALQRADIGVAMGQTGTAVSREAADMVLADDNFQSIRAAVEEGRRVYDNLVKALVFALPTNLAQALVVLLAMLFFPLQAGHPLLPILPVQILWVNLVVTVTLSLPLAFEAPEPNLMARAPRRPEAALFPREGMIRMGLAALVMTLGTLGLFLGTLESGSGSPGDLGRAQTLALTGLVLMQGVYLFSCRSLEGDFWRRNPLANPVLLGGVGLLVGLQIALVHLPVLQRVFHTQALSLGEWSIAFGAALVMLPLGWLSTGLGSGTSRAEAPSSAARV